MVSELDNYFSNGYQGLHWQMTSCEKFALQHILNHIRPAFAIEIGTYQGGSLQVLSNFCGIVDSIDIVPEVRSSLEHRFNNVNFYTGNSSELLPGLLEKHNSARQPVEFILIDGDHSTQGVRNDIEAILSVPPQKQITILMHDSFNPDCRAGILSADWQSCPYVHEVEVDFIRVQCGVALPVQYLNLKRGQEVC
jgi:cephalosporin hydroxylase